MVSRRQAGKDLKLNQSPKMNLSLVEASAAELRCVLAYESRMRNRPVGQTAYELIMGSVDIDAYPAELKARLDELQGEVERSAMERSLSGVEE